MSYTKDNQMDDLLLYIKDLTEYEKLYQQIEQFYKENDYWPTVAELAKILNWSERKAEYRVNILKRGGYIQRLSGCHRNIRIDNPE
jgi:SOS-response transcriptional repressor LexA